MNPEHLVRAAIKTSCDKLTDDELAAMNLCAQLGTDPRQAMGWEKAKPLFTERTHEGIPQVHDLTRRCLAAEALENVARIEALDAKFEEENRLLQRARIYTVDREEMERHRVEVERDQALALVESLSRRLMAVESRDRG